jgi:hypothetical protein
LFLFLLLLVQVEMAPTGTTGAPLKQLGRSGGGGQEAAAAGVGRVQRHVGDFMIIACDGVWDVMSNQAVGHFRHWGVCELTLG